MPPALTAAAAVGGRALREGAAPSALPTGGSGQAGAGERRPTERPRARTSEDESRVRLPFQASGAFRERATATATANDARDDDGRAVARDLAKTRRRARGGVEAMRSRRRAREDVKDDDRERTSRLVRESAVVG